MNTSSYTLSDRRICFIRAQGYENFSDTEISSLAFGNRFAYIVCTTILAYGVISANTTVLTAMAGIALLSVVLPNHPFDYIYNYSLRILLNKPELPPRSNQLKFACGMATVWIITTIFLFEAGFAVAAYTMGGLLVVVASLVSTTDFCIPSLIYNFLVSRQNSSTQA